MDLSSVDTIYLGLLWLEPDGLNLFGKETACSSEQLMFSSWDLFKKLKKWQTEMSKSGLTGLEILKLDHITGFC